jgi:hypothetical protein
MPDLRLAAVLNNADWCAAMAAAHGLASRRTARAWLCDAPMPPFYPNAVTLAPGLDPPALVADLPRGLPGGWGLKDSFRDLDLAGHGFAPLFDAEWMARAPGVPWPAAEAPVVPVTAPDRLARWAAAWGEAGARIFVPALLADPRVGFFAVEAAGGTVAGLAVMRSAGVLGFSNAFGAPGDLAACLRALGADAAIVGYGSPEEVAGLAPLGFRPTGPLRIWAKR